MPRHKNLQGKKILLVEDVEMNQYLARHIMESWGCIVEVVENGRLAVERISDTDYDLVLMDIQMPVMDGMDATRVIRALQDGYRSSIPIVALTANAMKADCENYLQIGMNDWLAKPFEEVALFKIISKNIRKTSAMNNTRETTSAKVDLISEEQKLYDLKMIDEISGGDRIFIQKMIGLFLETVPVTLNQMKNAADEGEWVLLSKHAHKLKSTIDSMGIVSLKQDIRDIELKGKTGENALLLRSLVDNVVLIMNEVISQVRRFEM